MANIKISELNPLLTVEDADVLPIVDNAVTKKVTAAILRSYTEGNSVLLTGAQTVAGIKTFTSQLASTVATGTAPFSVASTTKVTNLNADLLDGLSSADFQATLSGTGIVKSTAGTISYLTDNSTNWNTAFNDKINSAAVTGSGTNTLTLTQQDAGTITATWVNGTLIREIRNNTGATLTKGTIVYISGATGNKPTVSKAIATGDSTSAQTFGFVQENILNNANGYVVVIGDLTGVDTSAFAEGAQLYLSATTAGTFTDVKQYAPNHLVYVGIVTRAHPTLGQIEVNIQNGYELDELHNVAAQSPSNGDILQYVTSTGLWTKIAGTTSAISEGSNLYFTNARSRSAISLTTTGTSGAATYNSTTGVLNVPNYADTDTGITSLNGLTALTQTFAVGTSGTDFGISSATSTHTFNLPTASAANRGALSSADWTTFNNKASTAALANYLPLAGGTLTGALGGTSASFSQGISADVGSAIASIQVKNASTDAPFIGFYRGGTLRNALQLLTDGSFKLTDASLVANAGLTMGALNGTSATFSGALEINNNALTQDGTRPIITLKQSGTSKLLLGISSVADDIIVGDVAGDVDFRTNSQAFNFSVNNGGSIAFKLASSGAATFSADATINGVKVGRGAGNIASNTAVGVTALNATTIGIKNTAIGALSMFSNTTGNNNTAIGRASLYTNVSGDNNTAIGVGSLDSNTASNNTAVGFEAAYSNTTGLNTAIGYQSLRSTTTGTYNTALGYQTLYNNTGGSNTAIGLQSLYTNTTGTLNTAIGRESLYFNSTGSSNTAIGTLALFSNTASNNTAVGFEAAYSNTSGTNNTAIGLSALRANTTGSANIAIGVDALSSNTTGNSNSVLGVNAQSGNYSESIILGRSAAATGNNQFVVGSASYPAGIVNLGVLTPTKYWTIKINGTDYNILIA